MARFWTIQRAAGLGVPAGLLSLFLWPAYAAWEAAQLPFIAALAVTACCGLSILAFTAIDLATRKRGQIMRRLRTFDLVLGLLLAGPSLAALTEWI